MARPARRLCTTLSLIGLLSLSLGAAPAFASSHEGGDQSDLCVVAIETESSYGPIAGGTRTVQVDVLVRSPLGLSGIDEASFSVYRPDGRTLHATPTVLATAEEDGGETVRYTVAFDMAYHDAPTLEVHAYTLRVTLDDPTGSVSPTAIQPFGYDGLAALDHGAIEIGFGAIEPGQPSEPVTTQLQNLGNLPLDIQLRGADLAHERGADHATIPVTAIHFDTRSDAFTQNRTLSAAPTNVNDFDLMPGPNAQGAVHWYLDTPSASTQYLPAGRYDGSITLSAVGDHGLLTTPGGGPTEPSGFCGPIVLRECPPAPLGGHDHGYRNEDLAHDPGFAYEDLDGDLVYTDGVDRALTRADIESGGHTITPAIPGANLVVPASLGTVTVQGRAIFDAGDDGGVMLHTKLVAPDGILFDAGRIVDLRGAKLEASQGRADVLSGIIDARNVTFAIRDRVDIIGSSVVDVSYATVRSDKARATITSQGSLTGTFLTVDARDRIQIDATADLHVPSARLVTTAGSSTLFAGRDLDATCLHVTIERALDVIVGRDAVAPMSRLTSLSADVELQAGSVDITKSALHGRTKVDVKATSQAIMAPSLDARSDRATLRFEALGRLQMPEAVLVSRDGMTFEAGSGASDLSKGAITASGPITIETRGDLRLSAARIEVDKDEATADLGIAGAKLHVDDLHFADKDDVLVISPSTVTIVGQPARGGVSHA